MQSVKKKCYVLQYFIKVFLYYLHIGYAMITKRCVTYITMYKYWTGNGFFIYVDHASCVTYITM